MRVMQFSPIDLRNKIIQGCSSTIIPIIAQVPNCQPKTLWHRYKLPSILPSSASEKSGVTFTRK